MSLSRKWKVVVFIAIISSMVKDSQQCFSEEQKKDIYRFHKDEEFFEEDCYCNPENEQIALSWLGPDGQEITNTLGSEVFVTHEKTSVVLKIPRLSRALAGNYTCVAIQSDGKRDAIKYDVRIISPIYFLPGDISPQYFIAGQDSLIKCSARSKDGKPDMTWQKKDTRIFDGNKYKVSDEGLLIKSTTTDDAGQYLCSADVGATAVSNYVYIDVEAGILPKIISIDSSGGDQVLEGEQLTLTCVATGYPMPYYSWKKINESNGNYTWKQEKNKIIFDSVTLEDDGQYECVASNAVGTSTMSKAIRVLLPPMITGFNDTVEVEYTKDVKINCTAIGRPTPEIHIECDKFHDFIYLHLIGRLKTDSSPSYQNYNSISSNDSLESISTLTFHEIERHNSGRCYCSANNSVNFSEASMFLEVLHKPYFRNSNVLNEVVWTYDNSAVFLNCEHESKPPAVVVWRYLGDITKTDQNQNIDWMAEVSKRTGAKLNLDEPTVYFYYGNYECRVQNYLGEAKKQFVVKQGFSPAKLLNDQINQTDITASSITFEIKNETSVEAPPIIGYTAEYDEIDNYNTTDIHMNRTWAVNVPFKINKLKPGTTYKIKFAAVNLAGTGPFGDYYLFTTPEKSVPESPIVPDSPIRIPADKKVLKLTYPEDNGDPIDSYVIKYCRDDTDECIEEVVPVTNEVPLHHLSSNTSYHVEITAHNSEGNSTPANFIILLDADIIKETWLTAEALIGIAVVVVIICILIMDVLLFFTVKKGMLANCVLKKNKKNKEDNKQSRDKKGLLKDNRDSTDPLKRADNGHKEFEYNKSTGIITGKHSAV